MNVSSARDKPVRAAAMMTALLGMLWSFFVW